MMFDNDPLLYDVLIAGAGPVGLLLACELRLAGCTVLILEQAADPQAPTKEMPFGLRGLSVPTIEAFDRRGLLEPLRRAIARRETAALISAEQQQRRPAGHFAGIDFFYDRIEDDAWPFRLPGGIETFAADMGTIEQVLTDRAEALGVQMRRGAKVEEVQQFHGHVTVIASDGEYRANWLVGCDGGRSAVRKAAGVDFPSTEPEFTGYSVKVTLDGPAVLEPGRNLAPGGVYIYAPPGTIWMADFDGGAAHRSVPLDRPHVEAVLRKVSGIDVVITKLHLATTWTDRARAAASYRDGRIFLAGDAAHVHSPLGGQGLNLGLGDAMNLGWKLAAVCRGDAPAGLFDSYERERRPVAAAILERSRAQVALLRPDPGSRAFEAIMNDLIETKSGGRYFAERVSGIGLRYNLGAAHPLVGRSVPNFACVAGGTINEHLRSGRGLLVDFASCPGLQALTQGSSHVGYVNAFNTGDLDVAAALIRPDGIVAWATANTPNADDAKAAVLRWFGHEAP